MGKYQNLEKSLGASVAKAIYFIDDIFLIFGRVQTMWLQDEVMQNHTKLGVFVLKIRSTRYSKYAIIKC